MGSSGGYTEVQTGGDGSRATLNAYDCQKLLAQIQEQVTEEVNGIWSNPMRYHEVNWYWMSAGLRMHQKSMAWREIEVTRSDLQARSVTESSDLVKIVQVL
jgi:hypothetical protein